jgi:hypothetical protein
MTGELYGKPSFLAHDPAFDRRVPHLPYQASGVEGVAVDVRQPRSRDRSVVRRLPPRVRFLEEVDPVGWAGKDMNAATPHHVSRTVLSRQNPLSRQMRVEGAFVEAAPDLRDRALLHVIPVDVPLKQ